MHLVYGGSVLCDTSRLSELALEEMPTLWMLLNLTPSEQHDKLAVAAVTRLGIFAPAHMQPSSMQKNLVSDSVALLQGFAESLAAEDARW